MAYKTQGLPTCKKCGKQHFNFTGCANTRDIETAQRLYAKPNPPVWIEHPERRGLRPWNDANDSDNTGGSLRFLSSPMKERGSVTVAGGE